VQRVELLRACRGRCGRAGGAGRTWRGDEDEVCAIGAWRGCAWMFRRAAAAGPRSGARPGEPAGGARAVGARETGRRGRPAVWAGPGPPHGAAASRLHPPQPPPQRKSCPPLVYQYCFRNWEHACGALGGVGQDMHKIADCFYKPPHQRRRRGCAGRLASRNTGCARRSACGPACSTARQG
jgi:hypothetical protein